MARATHLTISTADRIRLDGRCGEGNEDGREDGENEIRQEVQVSITYALDPGDTDVVRLADRKALEVTLAHEAARNRIGAFRGTGGRSGGGSPSRCPSPCAAGEDRKDDEDREDENDDTDDGSEDDPLAGLPQRGDDPLGVGPIPAGAARPFPAAPTDWETQSGNGGPPQGGRYFPDARSRGRNSSPPVSKPEREPDPVPDAEPLTGPQKILIRSRARKIGLTSYALDSLVFQQFKVWKIERLSKDQAAALLAALERDLKEKEGKDGKEEVPHADRNGRAATA